MSKKPIIKEWPEKWLSGAKRVNLTYSEWLPDWFVGSGKDESCHLEGSWWDMICLARNILASENTKLVALEFYKPQWKSDHYSEKEPYIFKDESESHK